jgi:hypothetical protein
MELVKKTDVTSQEEVQSFQSWSQNFCKQGTETRATQSNSSYL